MRTTMAILLIIGASVSMLNAQKYTFPYGAEVPGGAVPGNVDAWAILATNPAARSERDIHTLLNVADGTNVTKLIFYVSGYHSFLQHIESARSDVQAGASPGQSGTTSIVSKGVAAQVLSLATEYGAVSRTDSKTASTIRANPVGIGRLLRGDEAFPYCAVYDFACESPAARFLESSSAYVSFNTTPEPATNAGSLATTNAQVLQISSRQIAGWGARYDFRVHKKPVELAKGFANQFNTQIHTAGGKYSEAVNSLLVSIADTPQIIAWELKYTAIFQSPETSDRAEFIRQLANAVVDLTKICESLDPSFKAKADQVLVTMTTYFANRDLVLDDYVNQFTFAAAYDSTRPANQPNQSSAKLILSYRLAKFGQLTANGTAEWYDQVLQSKVSRFRDAQAAVQIDHTFGGTDANVSPTVSGGYYFQYMTDKALLTLPATALAPGTSLALPGNASELLNTKGPIHLGQAKVTFSIRNSGVKFPIALTFSNRTDLIKSSEVRGNFGITYDFDSLLAKK